MNIKRRNATHIEESFVYFNSDDNFRFSRHNFFDGMSYPHGNFFWSESWSGNVPGPFCACWSGEFIVSFQF